MTTLHVVLPGDVSDPAVPSGGNTYDREVCQGLAGAGWQVRELAVTGAWPAPDPAALAGLTGALAGVPDGGLVLLDGLVAGAAPEAVVPESGRLRLVVLVHLPLDEETGPTREQAAALADRERRTLHAAAAVIATSDWAAQRLARQHHLPADRIHVASPGVAAARLAPGTDSGSELLCVAAVTPRKGHDLLVEALARVADRRWWCTCAGPVDRNPGFADRIRELVRAHGLTDRIRLVGPWTGADLNAAYATADLLVLASHAETYGMVVTEALARGTPVLATDVGGVPEALGRAPDGQRPGLLVPPGDPGALAVALCRWLDEPDLRTRLRAAARARRSSLPGWGATVAAVAGVLAGVEEPPG